MLRVPAIGWPTIANCWIQEQIYIGSLLEFALISLRKSLTFHPSWKMLQYLKVLNTFLSQSHTFVYNFIGHDSLNEFIPDIILFSTLISENKKEKWIFLETINNQTNSLINFSCCCHIIFYFFFLFFKIR